MRLLERPQLADESVELGVGNLGRVEDEVLLVVVLDHLAERVDAQLVGALRLVVLRVGHDAKSTDRLRRETRRDPLSADGELGGRAVIVHAASDLTGEQHRALGLAHAVAGESARRCDERLRTQP